jgi:2-C-methyl-D-erythritol 4-phosphate cytidylyltransferase
MFNMQMSYNTPTTAIIVAGGTGTRMGGEKPKQFFLLNGKPVLGHTLQSFLRSYDEMEIILVLPEAHLEEGMKIAREFGEGRKIIPATGGATRWESVRNGLAKVQHKGIVLVHDGVRCLVQPALIQRCCEQALLKGSAVPVVPATDSIRVVDGESSRVADRDSIRLVQTPQTFQVVPLRDAFSQCNRNDFTDEATVWEASGRQVDLIQGDYDNIKITRPVDLLIAAAILERRSALEPSKRQG